MKRRDFLNTVVVGAVAPHALSQSRAQAPPNVPMIALPRAKWIRNGIIQAEGTHEPYVFVVRRGGQRLDAYQEYQRAQSEEVIRTLKEQGVEIFETHFYKGFGMAAEMRGMEETKHAAQIAHRYGLRVSTYIQWNTMMYETFFAEEPRAKDWIQRDILGRPILLTYGYQQSFRYRPCFANQEYLDYLKKIVRYAVEEVETDFIDFDNFDLNPEPDSCHCPACVQGFRKFLQAKYSPEKRRERFGFETVDFINPPQWNRENPPEQMEIIYDPAIQEWVDYRCQMMADALQEIAVYAKSLNPEVVIEMNPHGITGGNRAWEAGLDHARLLKWTETYVTEESDKAGYFPDGRLVSKIRSYKLARAFQNILEPIPQDSLDMAECLAFNQTISWVDAYPLAPYLLSYIAFYRKYRDLYIGTEDVTPVAVLRSYPSITYHNARAQLSAVMVEQTLIQARIPFALIFDEHLAELSDYKVVVLPDSECLSDAQLDSLRRFVQDGGGLIATEQAGLYDEWRRLRVEPGLRGLVDVQAPANAYEETVEGAVSHPGQPAHKEVGKGRVVYLPDMQFDGPLPAPEPYFSISNRFWKLPKNWQEIVEAVQWASKEDIPITVTGPSYLVMNLVRQKDKRRMFVHLVNYNVKNVGSVASIDVRCRVPQGETMKAVEVYSPDSETRAPLNFATRGSTASFTVPQVMTYSVVMVSW
jgi:hypothetical protein